MIELDNTTSLEVNEELLNTIASSMTNKDIELIITSKEQMQEINKAQRGIDASTDVLSFPYEDMPMAPLGSIVISDEHVKSVAKSLKHSCEDEMALLFIHGLLHLLGYDHEVDAGEMRDEEKRLIKEFNLPDSLIIRSEEI
jgi:probable rRNA maturation factor